MSKEGYISIQELSDELKNAIFNSESGELKAKDIYTENGKSVESLLLKLINHIDNNKIHTIICTSNNKPKNSEKGQRILCIDTFEEFLWNGKDWIENKHNTGGNTSSSNPSIKDIIFNILQKLEDKEIKEKYISKSTQQNIGFIYSLLKNLDIFDFDRSTSKIFNNKAYSGNLITNEYILPKNANKINATLTQNEKIAYVREDMSNSYKVKTDTQLKIGDALYYNNELYKIQSSNSSKNEYVNNLSGEIIQAISNSGIDKEDVKRIIKYKDKLYFMTDHRIIEYDGTVFKKIRQDNNYINKYIVETGDILYVISHNTSSGKFISYNGSQFSDMTSTITASISSGKIYNTIPYKDGFICNGDDKIIYLFRDGNITSLSSKLDIDLLVNYKDDEIFIINNSNFKIFDVAKKNIIININFDKNIRTVAGFGEKAMIQFSDYTIKIYDDNTHLFTTSQNKSVGSITNIPQVKDYTLWFSTPSKLYKYDLITDTLQEKTQSVYPKGSIINVSLIDDKLYINTNNNINFLYEYCYGNIIEYTLDKELPLLKKGYNLKVADIKVNATLIKEEKTSNSGNMKKINIPYNKGANAAGSYIVELEGNKKLKSGDKIEGIRIKKTLSQTKKDNPIDDSDLTILLPDNTQVLATNSYNGQMYMLTITDNGHYFNKNATISIYRYNGDSISKICSTSIKSVAFYSGKMNFYEKDNYLYIDSFFYSTYGIGKESNHRYLNCYRIKINKNTFKHISSKVGACNTYRNQWGSISINNTENYLDEISSNHPILGTLGYQDTGKIYSGSFNSLKNNISKFQILNDNIVEILSTDNRSKDVFVIGNKVYIYDNIKVKNLYLNGNDIYGALMHNNNVIIYGNNLFCIYNTVSDTKNIITFKHKIYDIVEYDDELILATDDGLYRYKDDILTCINSSTQYTRLCVLKSNSIQQIDRLYAFKSPLMKDLNFKWDNEQSTDSNVVESFKDLPKYTEHNLDDLYINIKRYTKYTPINIKLINYHCIFGDVDAYRIGNPHLIFNYKSYLKNITMHEYHYNSIFTDLLINIIESYNFNNIKIQSKITGNIDLDAPYKSSGNPTYRISAILKYTQPQMSTFDKTIIKRFNLSDSVNAYELESPLTKSLEKDVKYEEINLNLNFEKLDFVGAEPSSIISRYNVKYSKEIQNKGKYLRIKFDIPNETMLDDFAIYID